MTKWFQLDPIRVGSIVAAVYAAGAMVDRAFIIHDGVFQPDVLVAAIAAVYGLFARTQTTSLKRPRDNAGRPLRSFQER